MTLPKYIIEDPEQDRVIPDKFKQAINYIYRHSDIQDDYPNTISISPRGVKPKPQTDAAGEKGSKQYIFEVITKDSNNGTLFSYVYLSEDANGNIYELTGYDRRSNPIYNTKEENIRVRKVERAEGTPITRKEVEDWYATQVPAKEKTITLNDIITQEPSPLPAEDAPAIKAIPIDPDTLKPYEEVKPYVSRLGKLHDLAKWATDEASKIYPQYAKEDRNLGHEIKYETLAKVVQLESGFRPDLKSKKSENGPAGLGQFDKETFDIIVKKYHLKELHPEIDFTNRLDPKANMLATAMRLTENINRPITKDDETRAYIIHNLGASGGPAFLEELEKHPNRHINPEANNGVTHNQDLYRDFKTKIIKGKHGEKDETVKHYGEWKTYQEAYDFIKSTLEAKGAEANKELEKAETRAKNPDKYIADVNLDTELLNNLAAKLKITEPAPYNLPTSGKQNINTNHIG